MIDPSRGASSSCLITTPYRPAAHPGCGVRTRQSEKHARGEAFRDHREALCYLAEMLWTAWIAVCSWTFGAATPAPTSLRPTPQLEELRAIVAQKADNPLRYRAEFLLGSELLRQGKAAEAVLPLSLAQGQIKEIDDVVRFELGRALQMANKEAEAETVFAALVRLSPDSDSAPLAAERLADLEWKRGAKKEALERLNRLISEGGDNARQIRLRQRQAEWLALADRKPEAVKVWKHIWLTYPEFEESLVAKQKLVELAGEQALNLEDRLQRARSLYALGHDEEAESIWLSVLADPDSNLDATKRCQLLMRRAHIAFRRKLPDVALELSEFISGGLDGSNASACSKNAELRHDGLKLVAKAQGQLLDFKRAAQTYGRLVKESKKRNEKRDLALLEAVVTRDAGDIEGADQRYASFVKTYGRDEKTLDARWFWGWMYFRLGDYDKAKTQWQAIIKLAPRSSLSPRVNYWLARMAEMEGQQATAKETYARVNEDDAWSYYGYLARERLLSLQVNVKVSRGMDLKAPKGWTQATFPIHHPRFQRAVTLYELGLDSMAAKALRGVPVPTSDEDALALAELHHALGDDHRAQLIVRTRFRDELSRADARSELLTLSYPMAFASEIAASSAAYKVEPEVVWAVMRQESTFRRDAISSANAQGLLQLIPRTAQRMARELQLKPPATFTEPAINIQLGTAYLGRLLESFASHLGLAAAAYNAGPPAVEQWLLRLHELPFDVWVEEIPFRETRDYVKKVVANYAAYRRIYRDLPTPLSGGLDRIPSASKGTIDF